MSWKELSQPGGKQEVLEGLRGCEKFWRLRSQNKTLFWYGAAHSSISTLCTHEWVKPYKTPVGKWYPPFYRWWNGSTEGAEARFQTWTPPVKLPNPKQGTEISVRNLSSHADMKGMAVCLAKPRLPVEQPISQNFGLSCAILYQSCAISGDKHQALSSWILIYRCVFECSPNHANLFSRIKIPLEAHLASELRKNTHLPGSQSSRIGWVDISVFSEDEGKLIKTFSEL